MATSLKELDAYVVSEAQKYGIDVNLVREIIAQESGKDGRYDLAQQRAVSPVGAKGYMQLMPSTAADMGVSDINDWRQNVSGGIKYLAWLRSNYAKDLTGANGTLDNGKLLAAYNAGIGAVQKFGGVPPYRETVDYVNKITSRLAQSQAANTVARVLGAQNVSVPPVSQGVDVAGLQATQNKASDLYAQSANTSQDLANSMAGLTNKLPDLGVAAQQTNDAQVAALSNLSSQSQVAVDATFNQLAAQDSAKRMILQSLLTKNNLDPTVNGSVSDVTHNRLTQINGRMNATIAAEQEMQDATISNNPGMFLQRMMFGNTYTQGRQLLTEQSNNLTTVHNNAMGTVANDAKIAADAKIADPTLLKEKLAYDMRINEMTANAALKQAEAPLTVAKAQTDQIHNIAQIMGFQASAAKDAATATAQSLQAKVDAVKLPYDLRQTEAQTKTSEANAVVASQNADLVTKYATQTSELKALELQAATAQQRSLIVEAQQKLAANEQLASSGKLTDLQIAETEVAVLKAKESIKGLTVASNMNTAINTATAQGMDAQSAVALGGLKNVGTQLEYQAKVNEYSKIVGEQAALAQGAASLGAKAAFNPDKLTVNQKAGIVAAAAGQPVAANPALAAKVLLDTGLANSSKYKALSPTVSAIGKLSLGKDETGKPIPVSAMKEEDLASIPKDKFDSAMNSRYGKTQSDGAIFNPSENPYGLAPPIDDVLKYLPESLKVTYSDAFKEVGSKAENMSNIETFVLALNTTLKSPDKVSQALSAYANASVAYNNANRGYNVLGLKQQDGMVITFSGIPTVGASHDFDITKEADASRLSKYILTDKVLKIGITNIPFVLH